MAGWIILGIIVLVAFWAVAIFNKLVKNRNLVMEGWSGIDVQLKRRYDLIPNLVETVKGYDVPIGDHETLRHGPQKRLRPIALRLTNGWCRLR